MAQLTLYLDESTQEILESSARASGLSKSRWVAELIRTGARREWPSSVVKAAGAFPDFPLREDVPNAVADTERIGF